MTTRRRQPRIGNRRHVQVYIDQALHGHIAQLASQEGISFSRAARELMERGTASLNTSTDSHVD